MDGVGGTAQEALPGWGGGLLGRLGHLHLGVIMEIMETTDGL